MAFHKKLNGFSLIELCIVLAILSVLLLVAYPSYQHYILKTKRQEGQLALFALAAKIEQYGLIHQAYTGATITTIGANTNSEHDYYQLAIDNSSLTATYYLLYATPHFIDPECGVLSLDQLGRKNSQNNQATCW